MCIFSGKKLAAEKEILEKENLSLATCVQEQSKQLGILENALTNAQANVVSLEEERCVKHVQLERLDKLTNAFTSLQAACEKRENMEKQLRSKLEKEVELLKSQKVYMSYKTRYFFRSLMLLYKILMLLYNKLHMYSEASLIRTQLIQIIHLSEHMIGNQL